MTFSKTIPVIINPSSGKPQPILHTIVPIVNSGG